MLFEAGNSFLDHFLPAETLIARDRSSIDTRTPYFYPPIHTSMIVLSLIRPSRGICSFGVLGQIRLSSSKRWQARQHKDQFTREAAVQGLKSRAAFKLLQIDEKYHIFKRGQTVVDLGYAPGSWSQVAVSKIQPNGRVLGVDIIPAQPPKGVSTIQGNFLAPEIQAYIQDFLRSPDRGRPRQPGDAGLSLLEPGAPMRSSDPDISAVENDKILQRTVDVVLSDMCEPWLQTSGFWKRSLSNPYNRMMNTSGNNFRDHAGSMDLCHAALKFSSDVLKTGGHFVCKFYPGAEDKELEQKLKDLFQKVHRLKPESSRSVGIQRNILRWPGS
ncbi:hypothetical protein N7520_007220 [Penicillium odoratum]|uniref:uncharacterized protein n=1 Tax=Penicillium odoratum TaxID=1167516 RepID=UPI002549240A|nr:uncharacterized protein N7520_007220 [Penicillium odoratum]KAJ5760064.1 hypothetical protein N7520_007220 [Penicillium odoratum]